MRKLFLFSKCEKMFTFSWKSNLQNELKSLQSVLCSCPLHSIFSFLYTYSFLYICFIFHSKQWYYLGKFLYFMMQLLYWTIPLYNTLNDLHFFFFFLALIFWFPTTSGTEISSNPFFLLPSSPRGLIWSDNVYLPLDLNQWVYSSLAHALPYCFCFLFLFIFFFNHYTDCIVRVDNHTL